ncbi:hypothetical protein Hanom_Chr07g00639261 [Helianthus anomalus]
MFVLRRCGYQGKYPHAHKKFLHPYWRLLAHVFHMCIDGNKGSKDTLQKKLALGMVALIMNWNYIYSKCVFEEMEGN